VEQLQLVASLGRIKRGVEKAALRPRYRFQLEVAKLPLFDGNLVVLWYAWTLIFFFYLFFLILYFFSFSFSFIDDEEACDYGHMTYHMM